MEPLLPCLLRVDLQAYSLAVRLHTCVTHILCYIIIVSIRSKHRHVRTRITDVNNSDKNKHVLVTKTTYNYSTYFSVIQSNVRNVNEAFIPLIYCDKFSHHTNEQSDAGHPYVQRHVCVMVLDVHTYIQYMYMYIK